MIPEPLPRLTYPLAVFGQGEVAWTNAPGNSRSCQADILPVDSTQATLGPDQRKGNRNPVTFV